jgi:hypothetical protein
MHEARSVAFACGLAYASVFVGACNAFDAAALERLKSPIESPRDAGRDAALQEPCTVGFELCNGKDDDCDDEIDENADVACVQPHAETVCATGGRCVRLECESGWSDCNGTPSDGCEYDEEQNGPCPTCEGLDCEPEMDAGEKPDADAPPEDAAVEDAEVEDSGSDACVEMAEACDDEDNDCDGRVDEIAECAILECVATAPSYRGAECDRCVCEKCAAIVSDCQNNTNATWRDQCRDVVECYVVQSRMGNCVDGDCYVGNGPCVGQIDTAANGDPLGNCTTASPPATACGAVTRYRDMCTDTVCMNECAD